MSGTIKQSIIKGIKSILDKRIEEIQQTIIQAIESRDNETKSSVGDKYETGRTMMQYELEKNKVQLIKTEKLKLDISKIELENIYNKIEFGSLVFTNRGNYFFSIPIGKIEIENDIFYCLSLASPIGKVLLNKKAGDQVFFQNNEITILEVE